MKSANEIRLEDLLYESVASDIDWPECETEICNLIQSTLPSEPPRRSISNQAKTSQRANKTRVQAQQQLFDTDLLGEDIPHTSSTKHSHNLIEIVKTAYQNVFDGYSVDRLIADVDKNLEFIRSCWRLNALASQSELNRTLLHARKNNFLGRISGVERYVVSKKRMDHYYFASEIAVKALQEDEFMHKQRFISVDDILCDPDLSKRFHALATSISPGFKPVDYRWAALTIRKASNRSMMSPPNLGDFELLGSLNTITKGDITDGRGLYWIAGNNTDIYVGHAENLRTQLLTLLDAPKHAMSSISEQLRADDIYNSKIGVYPTDQSASDRDPIKSAIVKNNEPSFNVLCHIFKVA